MIYIGSKGIKYVMGVGPVVCRALVAIWFVVTAGLIAGWIRSEINRDAVSHLGANRTSVWAVESANGKLMLLYIKLPAARIMGQSTILLPTKYGSANAASILWSNPSNRRIRSTLVFTINSDPGPSSESEFQIRGGAKFVIASEFGYMQYFNGAFLLDRFAATPDRAICAQAILPYWLVVFLLTICPAIVLINSFFLRVRRWVEAEKGG